MAKATPEIPSASMADIAFMLLIFFLVTTTMDTDSGILRMLPPPTPPDKIDEDVQIKERNIFVVLINKNDQLLVEGQPMDISELKEKAKEFIENPADEITLPEKEPKDIPLLGTVMVATKHVISLQNDRGTSYGIYIQAQNELAAAYNELKNEYSLRKFGKPYKDLSQEEEDAVRAVYKNSVSEAEPKNYGGGK